MNLEDKLTNQIEDLSNTLRYKDVDLYLFYTSVDSYIKILEKNDIGVHILKDLNKQYRDTAHDLSNLRKEIENNTKIISKKIHEEHGTIFSGENKVPKIIEEYYTELMTYHKIIKGVKLLGTGIDYGAYHMTNLLHEFAKIKRLKYIPEKLCADGLIVCTNAHVKEFQLNNATQKLIQRFYDLNNEYTSGLLLKPIFDYQNIKRFITSGFSETGALKGNYKQNSIDNWNWAFGEQVRNQNPKIHRRDLEKIASTLTRLHKYTINILISKDYSKPQINIKIAKNPELTKKRFMLLIDNKDILKLETSNISLNLYNIACKKHVKFNLSTLKAVNSQKKSTVCKYMNKRFGRNIKILEKNTEDMMVPVDGIIIEKADYSTVKEHLNYGYVITK